MIYLNLVANKLIDMDGVGIFIIVVLLIVILIVIVSLKSEAKKQSVKLNKNIITVYKKVNQLEEFINGSGLELPTNKAVIKTEPTPIKEVPIVKPDIKPKPIFVDKKPPIIKVEPVNQTFEKLESSISKKEIKKQPILQASAPKPKPIKKSKTDYEKLIGENLLNKIGIGILVIGIGFFVKYAIDQDWIGEFGRVAIGIGVGAILIAIAHFMRKNYKAFSSVLIGGGIGVFYYTISIAYHEYQIFTQPVAFGIMTLITITSVVLSIIYDKKEIAIIGIIGGFTSPFMVQGETENYVAFFTYIAILNTGMLALSYFKKWNVIQKLSYGFTILFFGGWLIQQVFGSNPIPRRFSLIMSSVFYLQFLGMSLLYNITRQLKFNALEFIQILSVNALFFLAGIGILNDYENGDYQGLFTACLAIFNIVIYFGLKTIKSIDKSVLTLFIGKTVSFVTLAILLQFDAYYTTLFWSLEAIVLLFLAQQSKQQLLKSASLIVTVIATFGLIYSWFDQYQDFNSTAIFDTGFISNIGVIVTYLISVFLLNKEPENGDFFSIPSKFYRNTLAFWAFVALYVTILIKLVIQLDDFSVAYYPDLIIWGYNLLMITTGLTFTRIKKTPLFTEAFTMVAILVVVGYVLVGNHNTVRLRTSVLIIDISSGYFFVHFIVVGLIIFLFYTLRKVSFQISDNPSFHKWGLVVLSVFGVAVASMELDHIAVFSFFDAEMNSKLDILRHTQTEGYTTLWGIYSFILIIYGMRQKNPHMRILSLVLFAVTLLKLFILDIQGMSEAGKIIAFISLGVLLLVVSFLYQKLRVIIVGEELKNKEITEKVE
jgi:uncharacterized membrane protein